MSTPRLVLALSGGAARCIAHIGVIQILEDAGLVPDAVAGVSGGSIIGAMYLDGMTTAEMERLAADTSWMGILRPPMALTGLASSDGIYKFILPHLSAKNIEDLSRPFAAVCADLLTGDAVVLTGGSLARAVQASCSLPVIFTPTEVDGRSLIDGGYVTQIPVVAARENLGGQVVVAVDVNCKASGQPEPRLGNIFSISVHLGYTFARNFALHEVAHADAVIHVDIGDIRLHDIKRHKELVARGREAAKAAVGVIRERLGEVGG